jgi:hypothetical protein
MLTEELRMRLEAEVEGVPRPETKNPTLKGCLDLASVPAINTTSSLLPLPRRHKNEDPPNAVELYSLSTSPSIETHYQINTTLHPEMQNPASSTRTVEHEFTNETPHLMLQYPRTPKSKHQTSFISSRHPRPRRLDAEIKEELYQRLQDIQQKIDFLPAPERRNNTQTYQNIVLKAEIRNIEQDIRALEPATPTSTITLVPEKKATVLANAKDDDSYDAPSLIIRFPVAASKKHNYCIVVPESDDY